MRKHVLEVFPEIAGIFDRTISHKNTWYIELNFRISLFTNFHFSVQKF